MESCFGLMDGRIVNLSPVTKLFENMDAPWFLRCSRHLVFCEEGHTWTREAGRTLIRWGLQREPLLCGLCFLFSQGGRKAFQGLPPLSHFVFLRAWGFLHLVIAFGFQLRSMLCYLASPASSSFCASERKTIWSMAKGQQACRWWFFPPHNLADGLRAAKNGGVPPSYLWSRSTDCVGG